MIFIPVIVVLLILFGFLKWLNDYEEPKNNKQQADLKNALTDFKNQLNIRK